MTVPHAQAGQDIARWLTADNATAIAAATNATLGNQWRQTQRTLPPSAGRVIVDVQNDTGEALDRWDALYLQAPVILPTTREASFYEQPAFRVERANYYHPSASVALLLAPCPVDATRPAILAGVVNCQIHVDHASHTHADVDIEGAHTKLISRYGGPAQILWKEAGTGDKYASLLLGPRRGNVWVYLADGETLEARDGTTIKGKSLPICYGAGPLDGNNITLTESDDGGVYDPAEMYVYNYAPEDIEGPKYLAVDVTDHGVAYVTFEACSEEPDPYA